MLLEHPFLNPDVFVLIEDSVLALLRSYVQIAPNDPESGGILLGYRRGEHLHLVGATEPLGNDVRGRSEFWRIDKRHESAAIKAWKESGSTLDYVGEWHTHPESVPSPSKIDLRAWKKILVGRSVPMCFLIVGTATYWVGIGDKSVIMEAKTRKGDLQ